jgi:hypothetical protein
VATSRQTVATILQALELTNGKTLDDLLKKGAVDIARQSNSGKKLAAQVYELALGRRPSAAELTLAQGLLGRKPAPEGVEDFLWAMSLLPEFQLIY